MHKLSQTIVAAVPIDPTTAILTFFNKLITIGVDVSFVLTAFFVLWGGFMWITSNGNVRQLESAKRAIFTALIGLAIVLTATTIANLVFTALGLTAKTQ